MARAGRSSSAPLLPRHDPKRSRLERYGRQSGLACFLVPPQRPKSQRGGRGRIASFPGRLEPPKTASQLNEVPSQVTVGGRATGNRGYGAGRTLWFLFASAVSSVLAFRRPASLLLRWRSMRLAMRDNPREGGVKHCTCFRTHSGAITRALPLLHISQG